MKISYGREVNLRIGVWFDSLKCQYFLDSGKGTSALGVYKKTSSQLHIYFSIVPSPYPALRQVLCRKE
jgi:hypothetical protein